MADLRRVEEIASGYLPIPFGRIDTVAFYPGYAKDWQSATYRITSVPPGSRPAGVRGLTTLL